MSNLYLHIPFCKQRCIYCDFYFVTTRRSRQPFLEALQEEIRYRGRQYGEAEPVQTIYFGGGTPSLLSVEELQVLLATIEHAFDTSEVREVTLEVNPDDIDAEYLNALRNTRINRLSIGVQSFVARDLQWMNRAHTPEQARDAVRLAHDTGFENFSVDLIFGIPGQSIEAWTDNLSVAIALLAPHLSTYSLTVEPRTPLHKRVQKGLETPQPEDRMETLYRKTMEVLSGSGYAHYEVSSFAQPGRRSEHNQAYWKHRNYLGLGPSAHSFWKPESMPPVRWENVRSLKRYETWASSGTPPVDYEEPLTDEQFVNERILLSLRTLDGLDLSSVEKLHAGYLVEKKDKLDRLQHLNLIRVTDARTVQLTEEGFLVCDAITQALIV